MFFQSRCGVCGANLHSVCIGCQEALISSIDSDVPGVPDSVVYAVAFEGRARQLILGLKYRNERSTAKLLANVLVHRLDSNYRSADTVTWAPTSKHRRRKRGHDQAELIARAIARIIHRPCRSLLVHQGQTSQTGASRRQRLHGPQFRARRIRNGSHVLVVDDVVTTGATLRAAAEVLYAAGAGQVSTVAVAATPSLESRR